jgi:hypothetical protein
LVHVDGGASERARYFFTGVGFIAFSVLGFGKLKKTEKLRLDELRKKFTQKSLINA